MTLKSILTASVAALALTVGSLAATGDALAKGGETPPLLAKAAANQPVARHGINSRRRHPPTSRARKRRTMTMMMK